MLPGAPEGLRGMINYRGSLVPLFDMSILLGFTASSLSLSTRIIITEIKYGDKRKTIGFLTEKATDIADIHPENKSHFEINLPDSPFLKRITKHENTVLRHLELDLFINENLRTFLFREGAE